MWLSEIGMSYYKARMYSPTMGRFMQTDPIGYAGDGPNLYAYVLNDPVNNTDPLGLACGSYIDVYFVDSNNNKTYDPGEKVDHIEHGYSPCESLSLGQDRGGKTGGGGMQVQRQPQPKPQPKPKKLSDACKAAAQEPGKILFTGASTTLAGILGISGGVGRFTNLSTGASGYYYTIGGGGGLEAAGGLGGGISSGMDAFLGISGNVTGAGGYFSGTFTFNPGGTGGSLNGAVGAGAAVTVTYTGIFWCKPGE